jgi:chemotaxis protein MotC
VRGPRLACALAATAIVAAALGGAPASAQTISDLTLDLQNLQARIAAGDKAAYASQTERISAVGAAILAAKPEVWQSKRETDSAVIYLLSGGQPRDIVRLVESGAVPASEIPLMRGVLAYVLGNEPEAEKRLSAIDARRLPLRLAGPMAFAQSVLETSHDSAKAIELLDLARLLAPGTLVEEAALRREIMLVADQHDGRPHRPIGAPIRLAFRRLGLRRGLPADPGRRARSIRRDRQPGGFDKFKAFFAALAPETRRGFLLGLARAAMLSGRFEVAAMAAAAALDGVPPDSVEEARGKLYEAMARILTPDYDAGLAELQSVAQAKSRSPRPGTARRGARRGGVSARGAGRPRRRRPPADAAAMASANPNDADRADDRPRRSGPQPHRAARRRRAEGEVYEPRRRHRRQRRADRLDAEPAREATDRGAGSKFAALLSTLEKETTQVEASSNGAAADGTTGRLRRDEPAKRPKRRVSPRSTPRSPAWRTTRSAAAPTRLRPARPPRPRRRQARRSRARRRIPTPAT